MIKITPRADFDYFNYFNCRGLPTIKIVKLIKREGRAVGALCFRHRNDRFCRKTQILVNASLMGKTALCSSSLYTVRTMLYCTICSVLYYIVLYCVVWYCIVLCCAVLCRTALFEAPPGWVRQCVCPLSLQCCTALHCTVW